MDTLVNFLKTYPNQINALAAVSALFVSLLSIVLTLVTLKIQRTHNFKSVTPVASILIGDYEDLIEVKLRNSGVGPLIIKKVLVSDGVQEKDEIISWMPASPPGIRWSTLTERINDWCIAPDHDIIFVQLRGDPASS